MFVAVFTLMAIMMCISVNGNCISLLYEREFYVALNIHKPKKLSSNCFYF